MPNLIKKHGFIQCDHGAEFLPYKRIFSSFNSVPVMRYREKDMYSKE